MKSRLMLLGILILSVALFSAGCVKYKNIYVFSFKAEQDLVNNLGEWIPEYATYTFNKNGVNVLDANLACPLRFSGDMRITVKFWLDVAEGTSSWVALGLSDSTWWCGFPANDVHMDLLDIGLPSEYLLVMDHNTTEDIIHSLVHGEIPGVVRNGFNYYVMTKTGDQMVATMNGKVIASFTLTKYASEWFGPNLASRRMGPDTHIGATFESIMVEYTGESSPMPYSGPASATVSSILNNR